MSSKTTTFEPLEIRPRRVPGLEKYRLILGHARKVEPFVIPACKTPHVWSIAGEIHEHQIHVDPDLDTHTLDTRTTPDPQTMNPNPKP